MSTLRQPRFLTLCLLVLLAAMCRLIPFGAVNFQPMGAIALFGGACFASRRSALLVPLFALLLSDLVLNLTRHSSQAGQAWMLTAAVYAGFAMVVGIGMLMRNRSRSFGRILGGSLAGSVLFFLVSNLGWWVIFYNANPASLLDCYWQAIAFFRGQSAFLNTIAADLVFNGCLFGALALAESRFPVLRSEASTAPQIA